MFGKQISTIAAILTASLAFVAQNASGQTIDNLGMRMPYSALKPTFAPEGQSLNEWAKNGFRPIYGSTFESVPLLTDGVGSAPGTFTSSAVPPLRSLADPVVAANNLGFFNDSDRSLSFQLLIRGVAQKVELGARQVLTMQIDDANAELKGVIGTDKNDLSVTLARGKIYVLRAEGGRWVLAAL